MSTMSESAAIIKLFFVPRLLKTIAADTLQATGAEDKPLLGSKLSADSGAETRLGFGKMLSPSGELIYWDRHQSDKSQGSGDRVPRKMILHYHRLISSVSACSKLRSFVGSMSPPSTSA